MIADPANADQLRNWDGHDGAYWAAHADQFDRSLAAYLAPLLDAAQIGRGDDILDVGCGAGRTTREASRRAGGGRVLGVDLSSQMLAIARERAAGEQLDNVEFVHADAQIHGFAPHAFDVAISRFGVMFFADPVAAFANIGSAMRDGGRLAALTWQGIAANEWLGAVLSALAAGRALPPPPADKPGPLAMSDPDRVHTMLSSAGWRDITLDTVAHPIWFGATAERAYEFVLGTTAWLLDDVDEATRQRGLQALRDTMEAHLTADGVRFGSTAWLIRARRG